MELASNFAFVPSTPVVATLLAGAEAIAAELGPLQGLGGAWAGTGFNTIRVQQPLGSDRFLELNITDETVEFRRIPGSIPNRGLLQGDLTMAGLHYLQQISDANLKTGQHIETGIWLSVPPTTDPPVQPSGARLASIPDGTIVLAQGTVSEVDGPP